MKPIILFSLLVLLLACQNESEAESNHNTNNKRLVTIPQNDIPTPSHVKYSWRSNDKNTSTIINRIAVPKDYKRKKAIKGSFAEWLRFLPLFEEKHVVKLHDGSRKWNQSVHYAVVDMDVGKADLQQCADAVMRLQAEYHYSTKAYDKIHFNYTSGDLVSFDDWRKGRRPKVSGNKVSFVNTGKVSDDYSNFKALEMYLFKVVFQGTQS